jgi:hypothetical protein
METAFEIIGKLGNQFCMAFPQGNSLLADGVESGGAFLDKRDEA